MYNISRELFEAVSEISIDSIEVVKEHIFVYKDTSTVRVSVYEFFFKCKEWALEQGHELMSGVRYTRISSCSIWNGDEQIYFESDSEQQAVFDATDYIRKELLKYVKD